MTRNGNDAEKHAARALQHETGMPYTQALAQVRRKHGDEGAPIDRSEFPCKTCWADRQIWYGNAWGVKHINDPLHGCTCVCHEGKVYLA